MYRSRAVHCITLFLLIVTLKTAFPRQIVFALQDTTLEDQDRARAEATAALARRENDRLASSPRFSSRDKTAGSPQLSMQLSEFKAAIPKLTEATDRYRWELGTDGKLSAPLRDIGAQADVMLRYLGAEKVNHAEPNASDFKGFTQAELQWEALNAAEQITTAAKLVVVADREKTVSVKTLEFLSVLKGELQRLRWLTSHLR